MDAKTVINVVLLVISIGLAVYDGELDAEELLHRADQALYTAKREGRNRLRMAA